MKNKEDIVEQISEDAVIVGAEKTIGVVGIAEELIVKCPLCNKDILEPYTHLNYYTCCGAITAEFKGILMRVLDAQDLHEVLAEARRLFEKSEYSSAARSAVIGVEDFIKNKIIRPDLFGVALINNALDSINGADPKVLCHGDRYSDNYNKSCQCTCPHDMSHDT